MSVQDAVNAIRAVSPETPQVAIVLGSGLGLVAEQVENPVTLDYTEIPGFPKPSVHGHAGRLVLGTIEGRQVMILVGRAHLYEGPEKSAALKLMLRTVKALGAEILFLTNAGGSMREDIVTGELVMIKDHVNFMGTNPLVGPNEDEFGPRFVDLEDCWDPQLRERLHLAAAHEKLQLHEGVFAGWMGPAFETPAEIKMLQILGCDTVGMSTVPENIVARHCGLRVCGVTMITNMACGLSKVRLSHEHTLTQAQLGAEKLTKLVRRFLAELT